MKTCIWSMVGVHGEIQDVAARCEAVGVVGMLAYQPFAPRPIGVVTGYEVTPNVGGPRLLLTIRCLSGLTQVFDALHVNSFDALIAAHEATAKRHRELAAKARKALWVVK